MSPFRALQAPVLLGSIEGSGPATFALPPTSGALQIVTPAGTTALSVVGKSSGASYSSGAPPASGISSVLVNEAVDRAVVVTVTGATGTTYVTTLPSSGFAASGATSSAPPATSGVSVVAPPQVVAYGSSGYSAAFSRSNVGAGNVLVVCGVKIGSSNGMTITGAGATWTEVVAQFEDVSGNYWANYTWVGTGTPGGSIDVTVTADSTGDEVGAVLLELSGAVAGTPVESSTQTSADASSLTLATLTANSTGDLVIATVASQNYNGPLTPWTTVSANSSSGQGGGLFYISATKGTGYAAQFVATSGTSPFAAGALIIAAG